MLHLYRFIEDAWPGGLRAWCGEAGERWILLENPGQRRWLLQKIGQFEITGIRIFDAAELRDEFARLAGVDSVPRNPRLAAFALRVAARNLETHNTAALAAACEVLSRAGWHLNQLAIDPAVTRRFQRVLKRGAFFPGTLERTLFDRIPALPPVCCIGWDAAHWPDLALLDLIAAKSAGFDLFVPSPRLPADGQQREWIEALEQRFHLERLTCAESGFTSANEPLVALLEKSELAPRDGLRTPLLLVGREWHDQVALVCGQVEAWLKDASAIGIVGPDDSPTAIAVAEALEAAGISVEHPGRACEPSPALLVLEQVARYHSSGHDVIELLELVRLLWAHFQSQWPDLEPLRVQSAIDRAFQSVQSRNSRILARALPWRKDSEWIATQKLIECLGRWKGDITFVQLREEWRALLAALALPRDVLPLPPSSLWEGETIPASAFTEWVSDEIAALRKTRPPPDYASLAPVVVTTFANAAAQSWSHLIFLDSNEHIWPAPIPQNPFLPDSTAVRLNQDRKENARLLTARDLRGLDHARFLDLIEHCRGSFAFAGLLLDQTDAGDRVQPNEWVLRSLMETAGDSFGPDLWATSARQLPCPASTPLDPEEGDHLALVHESRRNPATPFDRYQFNFNETKLEPEAWSATDLDSAITTPATFALNNLLRAKSVAGWSPLREEGAAVGNRAHRWLGRILELGDHLTAPSPAGDDDSKLARERTAARRELEGWYGSEGLPLPIWWETCLRKTEWATRRCLREIRAWLKGEFCAMEQSLAVIVQTPGGSLPLKGRIDILISDRAQISGANLRLFDFKTGRSQAPTLGSLAKGQGAQFAAYYLMARDAGATEAVIGIIKPEEPARDIFSAADEASLRAHFSLLANLRRTLRFGRRGPLFSDYSVCETLPLATVPIDPSILEQKAGLALLAS